VTRSRSVGTVGTVGTSEICEASARSALRTKYGIFFFTIIDNVAQSDFAPALRAFCDKGVNQPPFFSTNAVYAVSDGLTERHVRILTLPYTQVSAKKKASLARRRHELAQSSKICLAVSSPTSPDH